MEKLTPKEQLVYDYIVDTIRREGYAPSVRDIATAVDMKSTSTVHHYIGRLEAKGYIQKESGKSRTLRIEKAEQDTADKIPVLGRVAADQPILATENFEGYVAYHVNRRRYNIDNLFALIIKGESMIEAGIMNGDTVIVDKLSVPPLTKICPKLLQFFFSGLALIFGSSCLALNLIRSVLNLF